MNILFYRYNLEINESESSDILFMDTSLSLHIIDVSQGHFIIISASII